MSLLPTMQPERARQLLEVMQNIPEFADHCRELTKFIQEAEFYISCGGTLADGFGSMDFRGPYGMTNEQIRAWILAHRSPTKAAEPFHTSSS